MNTETTKDFYSTLFEYCSNPSLHSTIQTYKELKGIVKTICSSEINGNELLMTNLQTQLNYVCNKHNLRQISINSMHSFNINCWKVLYNKIMPTPALLMRDIKAIAYFISYISKTNIPTELLQLFPKVKYEKNKPLAKNKIKKLRVTYHYKDNDYLFVSTSDENFDRNILKVKYNNDKTNSYFAQTCDELWHLAQLNLLDVEINADNTLLPSIIVLEPDYLIDISTLAETFKEYGNHPSNYFLSRLQKKENTRFLLLGNIANLFLDEWIFSEKEPDYLNCMQKAFKCYPIELSTCEDLKKKDIELDFFNNCKLHFQNIKKIFTEDIVNSSTKIDTTDAVLEPSYICEALGLQGRLDYMQKDMSAFIEMKSGRANDFNLKTPIAKENNLVQMMLYLAVLEYSMNIDHNKTVPYLLYTRYPILYTEKANWAMVKKAINTRNCIVAADFRIQNDKSLQSTIKEIKKLSPEILNTNGLKNKLWTNYICPQIQSSKEKIENLSELEKDYFYSTFRFITKEMFMSKSGSMNHIGSHGSSSLWTTPIQEKYENGEIISNMLIIENNADLAHKPTITLNYSDFFNIAGDNALPNFRTGDTVILYERNTDEDNATNKLIFKGNVESINNNILTIRLRAPQKNLSVLPEKSRYAIEHDFMDTTFKNMFTALAHFCEANIDRRKLLLCQREPEFDTSLDKEIELAENDFDRIALKAKAAKDFFLLVGPPGTGKTSRALKRMVEIFSAENKNIILLSYTNRAVDEICKTLSGINASYIRVGSELSCDEAYRSRLIENIISDCKNRNEISKKLEACNIYVATVATMSNRPELFNLKTFDVAIIDEATQILEPQLLSMLCIKNSKGKNGIGKFIMIGDHKQLPAVLLQSEEQAQTSSALLKEIGLDNFKNSLFERLHRTYSKSPNRSRLTDMLVNQGRMHDDVASFANTFFYCSKLNSIGLEHQTEILTVKPELKQSPFFKILNKRLVFIPSQKNKSNESIKTNTAEAITAAKLAADIYKQYEEVFDPQKTLGIITPYRSQISMIKREIEKTGIAQLKNTLIDTVERFQGSERDVIIYSFCINKTWQLNQLSNISYDEGVMIDRKLNVAITRARKQLFLIGVPELLEHNQLYKKLMKFCEKAE